MPHIPISRTDRLADFESAIAADDGRSTQRLVIADIEHDLPSDELFLARQSPKQQALAKELPSRPRTSHDIVNRPRRKSFSRPLTSDGPKSAAGKYRMDVTADDPMPDLAIAVPETIGVALGSPTEFVLESGADSIDDPRYPALERSYTGSTSAFTQDSRPSTSASSKLRRWKTVGSIFGRKKRAPKVPSPSLEQEEDKFPELNPDSVRTLEDRSLWPTRSSSIRPPSRGRPRKIVDHDVPAVPPRERSLSRKPFLRAIPSSMRPTSSRGKKKQADGSPTLDVNIPQTQLDRYSIMFSELLYQPTAPQVRTPSSIAELDPMPSPSTPPKPSLLERRHITPQLLTLPNPLNANKVDSHFDVGPDAIADLEPPISSPPPSYDNKKNEPGKADADAARMSEKALPPPPTRAPPAKPPGSGYSLFPTVKASPPEQTVTTFAKGHRPNLQRSNTAVGLVRNPKQNKPTPMEEEHLKSTLATPMHASSLDNELGIIQIHISPHEVPRIFGHQKPSTMSQLATIPQSPRTLHTPLSPLLGRTDSVDSSFSGNSSGLLPRHGHTRSRSANDVLTYPKPTNDMYLTPPLRSGAMPLTLLGNSHAPRSSAGSAARSSSGKGSFTNSFGYNSTPHSPLVAIAQTMSISHAGDGAQPQLLVRSPAEEAELLQAISEDHASSVSGSSRARTPILMSTPQGLAVDVENDDAEWLKRQSCWGVEEGTSAT